ncbi:hypothetical protein Ndes2526A_g07682 [Nannochloris sp. 'desiccata']
MNSLPRKPLIVIDEANMLMDWTEPIPSPQSGSSQPKLLKLLAFLVAISKEANLVHVILATSDYFLASWLKEKGVATNNFRIHVLGDLTEEEAREFVYGTAVGATIDPLSVAAPGVAAPVVTWPGAGPQVHEPLLDAELGLRGASNTHLWRGAIEHHRALATLTLSPDGSFQLKEDPPGYKFLFTFPKAMDISVPSLDVVGASLSDISSVQLCPPPAFNNQQQPQRRVLAIINPASGRGIAPKVYSKQIKPILQAAGMLLTEATTTATGHATEITKNVLPNEFDLILSLGGDGTMFEVLQGVLQRPDWELMSTTTALLQIPCGSGNALAASTGLWDVATAAHAAVKGHKQLLDIASVVQLQGRQEKQEQESSRHLNSEENGGIEAASIAEHSSVRFFSFLSCTYGMLSCLDIGTEHLRWLGGTRFIVGAIQQIVMQHTFKIKVAYLDADSLGSGTGGGTIAPGGDVDPIEDGTTNTHGWHGVTENVGYGPSLQYFKEFSPIIHARSRFGSTTDPNPNPDLDPSATEIATATATAASASASTPPFSLPLLPSRWHWLPADTIQVFAACNLPQLDMNFNFAPEATLNSGHFNLLYTTGRSGWLKGFSLLTAAEKGQHMHLVQQRKLKAYWIEPLAKSGSTWLVCDGEEVPHRPVYAEVHAGLVTTLKAPNRES